jgi:hypothetical protein
MSWVVSEMTLAKIGQLITRNSQFTIHNSPFTIHHSQFTPLYLLQTSRIHHNGTGKVVANTSLSGINQD